MIAPWLLLACTGGPADRALDAVAGGRCAEVGHAGLQVVCWTEAAVEAARAGDGAGAAAACDALPAGLWREECHFRAGEELGLAGHVELAAQRCAAAGRYADFCLIHLAWWARPFPIELRPDDLGADAAIAAELARLGAGEGAGAAMLRTSAWFDLYYGAGSADPGPARRAGSPEARTAWAHEAVRLGAGREAWQDGARGPAIEPRCWAGRVAAPAPVPGAGPTTPTVHGGTRLVGEDEAEDLEIALAEAAAFHSRDDEAALRALLADPRPRLRWTAGRLLARLGRPVSGAEADAVLAALVRAEQRGEVVDWAASEECR